jgi:hypothetical protein
VLELGLHLDDECLVWPDLVHVASILEPPARYLVDAEVFVVVAGTEGKGARDEGMLDEFELFLWTSSFRRSG